jgi:hypothetical protein
MAAQLKRAKSAQLTDRLMTQLLAANASVDIAVDICAGRCPIPARKWLCEFLETIVYDADPDLDPEEDKS